MVLLAIPSVIPYFTVIPDVRQAHTVDYIFIQYFTVIPFAFQEAFPRFCLPKPHVHILVFSRINCHITVRKQT